LASVLSCLWEQVDAPVLAPIESLDAREGTNWTANARAECAGRFCKIIKERLNRGQLEKILTTGRPVVIAEGHREEGCSPPASAGSLRAGQRAANIMSLIQSAKLNGHDPYGYFKDVLKRLPTQSASHLAELPPHRRHGAPEQTA
jgi:hypothetical protein